jgi:hypothetical protein
MTVHSADKAFGQNRWLDLNWHDLHADLNSLCLALGTAPPAVTSEAKWRHYRAIDHWATRVHAVVTCHRGGVVKVAQSFYSPLTLDMNTYCSCGVWY